MLYHGEHGRLQGTQGTYKYILTILCLVLDHVISWRTWMPTRNSRHTQVHINYLVFGARHGRLQGTQGNTQVHINYLVFGARPCYIMENMDAYKELKAHTSTY